MLTIVRQEPDGKLELLQQHNKEELARLQHTPSRNNSIRRSTIHVPEQSQPLYCPSHRRLSITPSIPSITPSMNSIFKFRRYGILVIPLYDSTNIIFILPTFKTNKVTFYIYLQTLQLQRRSNQPRGSSKTFDESQINWIIFSGYLNSLRKYI